jgi:hypothetical protein
MGVARTVSAGFELELGGAERYRERETPDDTELAATNVLTRQCISQARRRNCEIPRIFNLPAEWLT